MGGGLQLTHRGTARADDRPHMALPAVTNGLCSPETHCHHHDRRNGEHPLNPLTATQAITPAP